MCEKGTYFSIAYARYTVNKQKFLQYPIGKRSSALAEDEYGNTPAQRAELDWLLYNKPLEYAQMVLRGEMERYLSLGCDNGRLED